jgi:hypothetical protein
MRRFVEGVDRGQSTLFPECLDDWIDEDNPVGIVTVTGGVQRGGEVGPGFMRRQPHLATGRLLRL